MKRRTTCHCDIRLGFTVIELLAVISVIAILATLLLPALAKGKAAAQSAACKSNLRQLGIALNLYVDDWEKYPGPMVNGLLQPGLGGGNVIAQMQPGHLFLLQLAPYLSLSGQDACLLGVNNRERRLVWHCPSVPQPACWREKQLRHLAPALSRFEAKNWRYLIAPDNPPPVCERPLGWPARHS